MRRLIFMLVGATAALAATAGIAAGAGPIKCKVAPPGTPAIQLALYCQNPQLTVGPVSVVCHAPGASIRLPAIKVRANAGIARITVSVDGRTIRTFKYNTGPTSKTVRVTVRTVGLRAGVHTVRITTVDNRNKRVSTTRRFAICRPVPHFTG
jgi:hypothetical protein